MTEEHVLSSKQDVVITVGVIKCWILLSLKIQIVQIVPMPTATPPRRRRL